ncbi:MAG: ATP-binding protein [Nannocystaceae bacterium]
MGSPKLTMVHNPKVAVTREQLIGLEILTTPVWVFDFDFLEMWWANPAAVNLWSAQNLEELLARDFAGDLSEASRTRLTSYRKAFEAQETCGARWTFYPQAGPMTAECMLSGIRIRDEQGERLAMLVEAKPVPVTAIQPTERRHVESLRHCSEMVSLYSDLGEVLLRNPAAKRQLGEGVPNMPGQLAKTLVDAQAKQAIRRCLAAGEACLDDLEVHTLAGIRWHRINIHRTVDPVTGKPAILVSQHDISKRRAYQQQLEDAQRKLQRRSEELKSFAQQVEMGREEAVRLRKRAEAESQAKSDFLATMSHELRTPMTGVLGMADLLLESRIEGEARELTQHLRHCAVGLLDHLNDILDHAKIEAGKLSLEEVDFSPRAVLADVGRLLRAVAWQQKTQLHFDVTANAPMWVRGDPRRFQQILINLVGNALKFTKSGQVAVTISSEPSETPGGLYLVGSVRDTGIGMTQEQLARMFTPFEQAESSTARRYGGTGLGLAIVQKLCRLMDGTIAVESSEGQGSTFTFRVELRLGQGPNSGEYPAFPAPQAAQEVAELGGLRVLAADDNAVTRLLLTRTLQRWGCMPIVVPGGVEVLDALAAQPVDIVLLDMHMPGLDGVQTTARIRKSCGRFAGIPIIALTADLQATKQTEFRSAGANICLPKPIDRDLLAVTIQRLCSRRVHHRH